MAFPVTANRNSNWIATEALYLLIKASVDNPPSAQDLALALDRLDAVAANLSGRGVVYIADLDAVPAGIALEVAYALALALAPAFGDASPPGIPPQAQIDANLRRITSDMASYGPAQVSFI